MAKIDEIKEILNSLRLFFSIAVGLIVVLTGALITKEQNSSIDVYFWLGSAIDILIMIGLVKIIIEIKKNISIIKDL